MAMDVFDLQAVLSLDDSAYNAGLDGAEGKANSFGSKLGGALGNAAKVGGVAIGAIAAGTTALGTGLTKAAGDAAEYGDNIDKMSQKMGVSAEKYQEWDAILQHSGSSMESMKASMKTLANAAETGSDAFDKLGISQEDVANMSQEELFEATITGLQNVSDTTKRTYLAGKLLGRGATELGALLNTSAEDTEAMRQRVHELGGVMSDEAVKASAAYQDQLQDMQTAMSSTVRNISSVFLPSITEVMSGVTELFSGNREEGFQIVQEGIGDILERIVDLTPEVMEIVQGIGEAIIRVLTDNLPRIMEVGTEIILELLNGIIANLPSLTEAAVQAIVVLSQGIGEALPDLIPAIVDAILTIVDVLIDNAPMLIDGALALMLGLAEGLINAIPVIIERLPEIIESIIKALAEAAPKIAEAGFKLLGALVDKLPDIISAIIKVIPDIITSIVGAIGDGIEAIREAGANLIAGLAEGITEKVQWLVDKVKQVGGWILDAIRVVFGIASPSKEFRKIGDYLMQGLSGGIEGSLPLVEDAMDDVDDAISDAFGDDEWKYETPITTTMTSSGEPARSGKQTRTDMLLAEILEALYHLGINIDGRAMVGQIAPYMDERLGLMNYYDEREVYA